MYTSDKEAAILEHIYNNDSLKQRELADRAGVSLGMANAIVKRLIAKGYLMASRLNSRNIRYVVSPAGMEEVFKRGYRYFQRTIADITLYREGIEELVHSAAQAGYTRVVLAGKSDLDFLVEYACGKAGLAFSRSSSDAGQDAAAFTVYSEQYEAGTATAGKGWLRTVVMKKQGW